jgi:hypothetical protein
VVQQVLAVRLGAYQDRAGQSGGAGGEPALRAGGPDALPAQEVAMTGGESVDGVSLGHGTQRYSSFVRVRATAPAATSKMV